MSESAQWQVQCEQPDGTLVPVGDAEWFSGPAPLPGETFTDHRHERAYTVTTRFWKHDRLGLWLVVVVSPNVYEGKKS